MLSKVSKTFNLLQKRARVNQLLMKQCRAFSQTGLKPSDGGPGGVVPKEQMLQFSKAPIQDTFGDLPFGEIPEPLKFVRPFKTTTLSNGIRVCTEATPGATSFVGVYVGAGSRNESLQTTGTSYLLQKMALRGTNSMSKTEQSASIENMGAQWKAHSDREWTSYGLQTHKGDSGKAVQMLGDAICNIALNPAELEALKVEVANEHEEGHTRYMETTLEASHFNVYREHMMGQPIKGDRDFVGTISADMLRDYHTANYYGDNIVVVATGDVSHDQIVDQVEQNFSSLPAKTSVPTAGSEKAVYIPALYFMRDDEMINSNVGLFYDAPSIKHEDYYAFLLLKHIMGTYRIDENSGHLNDVHKQYNSMHSLIGDLPDVTMADAKYFAYSDCGIFGNYFFGNEIFTRQMNYCGVCIPTIYGHYMNDVECIRGRNHLFNELLNTEDPASINSDIGQNMLQLGRRLPRSEIAKRVAHLDNYHMKNMCYQWFYDAEPSFTNWGPIETMSSCGSYKYFKINTMSTVTNAHHTLFT